MRQSAFMHRMVKLMKAEKKKKDPFASGESFTTLHNKAGRDAEHQQLLREQGFPSEQDPNAMRYQRYMEVESDPDSPDGVAHNTPPWIVNEASELLADIPDEDAPSYPKSEKAKNRSGELSKSEGIKYGSPITPERYQPIEKGLFDKVRGKKKKEDSDYDASGKQRLRRSPEGLLYRREGETERKSGIGLPPYSDTAEVNPEAWRAMSQTPHARGEDVPPFLRPQEEEESSRLTEGDFESLEAAKAAQARNRKLMADKKLAQAQQKATKAETKVDKLPPFLEQSLTKRLIKLQKQAGPTRRPPQTPDTGGMSNQGFEDTRSDRSLRGAKIKPSFGASKPIPGMANMTRSEYRAGEANKRRPSNSKGLGYAAEFGRGVAENYRGKKGGLVGTIAGGAKSLYDTAGDMGWLPWKKSQDLDTITKRLIKLQKQSPSEGGPQRWRYQPRKENAQLRGDASPEEQSAYAQGRKRSSQVGEFASMGGKPGGTITLPSDASPESIQALRDMSAQAERQRSGMGEFKDAGPMDYKTQVPNRFPWVPDVKVNPNTGVFQTHPTGRLVLDQKETPQKKSNYNFAPSGSPSTQTSSKKVTPKTSDTGGMSNQGFEDDEDIRTLSVTPPKFRYR